MQVKEAVMLALSLLSAYSACFCKDRRLTLLLVGLSGLFSGWVLLLLDHEMLAVFSWLVSTAFTLVFLFYQSTLKEEAERVSGSKAVIALLISGVFVWVFNSVGTTEAVPQSADAEKLPHIAASLSGDFFLTVVLIGLLFLILAIGSGDHMQNEGDE
jgi:NADH:ubiquinone oxidoreductase subunit 6 (subunit J)